MTEEVSYDLTDLTTEKRNRNSMTLDQMSTIEMVTMINEEDKKVALAVEKVLPDIVKVVDLVHKAFLQGGRLFYIGAGTSGRIGVLDASECIPTFMTSPDMVQAIIAGGEKAFVASVEASEDDEEEGRRDLKSKSINKNDVVIGIAASGRTPYVVGALKFAQEIGATTVSLACNRNSIISRYADFKIEVITGSEVLTGSTRMKAATAQKMILNMISTATMVKMGKVYENLMVDVQASNHKLRERSKQIVMEITGATYQKAEEILKKSNQKVKPAIIMLLADVSFEEASQAIQKSVGNVRFAIELCKKK
ncbi:N-acetylmuramic acid 6-phosphate etherase [Aquibacillus sp. 3ASR75-11]|uniref:N-acetylmuramic acid 6-phosphate etherase n=1 Tax=Terrihalobacillus insolitus TaxID=2950438 RepID=A0A9X4ALE2_9BACI|nr:N-acetylmuramic acid 6-phosphate etherase [Terrihalobacillus insolitus]MDC3414046.1 N-acetylmuramic acid 6-phosphate etherase [Terrihalobacillus insolitus]MDC3424136.1 N-acetylmuramic acid 6-phosphate etherase [Terrihalobacillus insolitus]